MMVLMFDDCERAWPVRQLDCSVRPLRHVYTFLLRFSFLKLLWAQLNSFHVRASTKQQRARYSTSGLSDNNTLPDTDSEICRLPPSFMLQHTLAM
jgi:hypothetical protein